MDNKITLRAPEPDDTDAIYTWENDSALFESLPNPAPLSRFQIWEYIQNYKADPYVDGQLRLVVCKDTRPVGLIDLCEFNPTDRRASVGIYIAPAHRHNGIATAALALLCDYAAGTLGLHQLFATIALDNVPSKTLFTSAGFRPSGRLRSWIRRGTQYADAIIFQKLFK